MKYNSRQKEEICAEYAKSYDSDRIIAVGESVLKERAQFLVSKLVNPSNVLDLGCGTGLALEYIWAKNPHGLNVGIDISKPMMEQAKERLSGKDNVFFVKQDVSSGLPFFDKSFDYVVASNIFQEIPDMEALLSEAVRVLKSGGFIAAMIACLEDTNSANLVYSRISEEYLWYFKPFSEVKQIAANSGLNLITEEKQFLKNPRASLIERDNKMKFSIFNEIMQRVAKEGENPENVSQGHYKFIAQK